MSGIGFLGAGLIFREGLSVRGLNTAATIWCSAAVGVLAGNGFLAYAGIATGFVLIVNLLLRPIVIFINRQPMLGGAMATEYLLSVTCRPPEEAHIRALLLQGLAGSGLHRLDSNNVEGTDRVAVTASLSAANRLDPDVEKIIGRLSLEPTVSGAHWQVGTSIDGDGRFSWGSRRT